MPSPKPTIIDRIVDWKDRELHRAQFYLEVRRALRKCGEDIQESIDRTGQKLYGHVEINFHRGQVHIIRFEINENFSSE